MSTLLIGGLGWPYDTLLAATLRGGGMSARAIAPLDAVAYERGRAALPRGQCAPALYTTGALLRSAESTPAPRDLEYLSLRSCGPCRFALFEIGWARALHDAGLDDVRIAGAGQSITALAAMLGPEGLERLVETLIAGDVIAECTRRVRPHAVQPETVDRVARNAVALMCARLSSGTRPLDALRACGRWHESIERRRPSPLARVLLIGEPWSAHVDGDAQLNLPRVLARAGAEVEAAPLTLWIAYQLWQRRQDPWGSADPASDAERAEADLFGRRLEVMVARASDAAGLDGFEIASVDELARLAEPYLPASTRGGYGHVEVGLAVRAREQRRAHLVLSVKSFGCLPSSSVSDAIVPTALEDQIPFLALDVASDSGATIESRLMLRVAVAIEAAHDEVKRARRARPASVVEHVSTDPLAGRHEIGPRPYACNLACDLARWRAPV